jgi:exodeoxyribonuclease-1
MQQSPKPVRRLRCNAAPILAAAEDAPNIAIAKLLGRDELDRRAALVGAGPPLLQRLIASYEAAREVRPPSAHFEEQIYDGFPSQTDQQRMEIFHQIPWEKRGDLVRQVDDLRAREFGSRLIHAERPEILDRTMRAERDRGTARRIAGTAEDVPWLTLPSAISEAQALLAEATMEDEAALLRGCISFFESRLEQARLLV